MPAKSRWEWVPPPNWPKPPSGWSPSPGWQPDPSWPPPPDGWFWWRQRRRPRSQRIVIGGVLTVVCGLVVLLIAAQIIDDTLGCGSVDPTDPSNYSVVTILNDTSRTVIIDDCNGDYCNSDALPHLIEPGKSYTDDAACAAYGSNMTSWRLTTMSGQVLGYIAVRSPRSVDDLVYDVSQASRDRTTPTPPS